MKSTKNIIITVVIIAGSILVSLFVIYRTQPAQPAQAAKLDGFAQCLAEKKITMYGAAWCSHCQNEKKAFGSSFKYIPYVECPDNPKACLDKGIKGYPTWIFPDGKKLEGEQGLEKLSNESGCSLPE